ncbi:MAG: carbohydrate kinase [Saprospiraceae bacterium]|nr:carbohydrate kinase [Saprospiraceae bacterium]
MYLLGYDIGSSTIKAALVRTDTQQMVALTSYPEQEMDMLARQSGWAEQQPELWWQDLCVATQRLIEKTGISPHDIKGIGISYQMHGLVLIDKDKQVLRPAIIWCDSRAVPIGQQAFLEIGEDFCLQHLLNSPGNFTASKLRWVKDNEPHIYEKINKILLPGDFIAMMLTGEVATTIPGLTEGIFWDFKKKEIAKEVLDYFQLDESLLPNRTPTFSLQGTVTKKAAERTGLAEGTPVSFRAGDQPCNALSLNVMHPGEVAATCGTSGVVYGIVDQPVFDSKSRVNAFAHVNYEQAFNRIGVLLCLNGAGIQYSWIKHQVARGSHTYADMERMVSTVPVGSEGLCMLPYGNGAERMLDNRNPNAHVFNIQFNRHTRGHLYRAALEGVAFSFAYGINILKEMGLNADLIRVGNDNMFQSKTFSTTLATMLGSQIEVVETTGAVGAAKAAGLAIGVYRNLQEALSNIKPAIIHEPQPQKGLYDQAFSLWLSCLEKSLDEQSGSGPGTDQLKKRSRQLEAELKTKTRDLASTALLLVAKNDLLLELKHILQSASDVDSLTTLKSSLRKLVSKVDAHLNSTDDWAAFEEHFNLLHSDLFKKIKNDHPTLSVPELKMCAYLIMGLSTKEIAQRLHLSMRGTETARFRLRKKLGIEDGLSICGFLEHYQ